MNTANVVRRIKKANNSFNVMGDMMLRMEMDHWTLAEMVEVESALKKANTSYPFLSKKIEREINQQAAYLNAGVV